MIDAPRGECLTAEDPGAATGFTPLRPTTNRIRDFHRGTSVFEFWFRNTGGCFSRSREIGQLPQSPSPQAGALRTRRQRRNLRTGVCRTLRSLNPDTPEKATLFKKKRGVVLFRRVASSAPRAALNPGWAKHPRRVPFPVSSAWNWCLQHGKVDRTPASDDGLPVVASGTPSGNISALQGCAPPQGKHASPPRLTSSNRTRQFPGLLSKAFACALILSPQGRSRQIPSGVISFACQPCPTQRLVFQTTSTVAARRCCFRQGKKTSQISLQRVGARATSGRWLERCIARWCSAAPSGQPLGTAQSRHFSPDFRRPSHDLRAESPLDAGARHSLSIALPRQFGSYSPAVATQPLSRTRVPAEEAMPVLCRRSGCEFVDHQRDRLEPYRAARITGGLRQRPTLPSPVLVGRELLGNRNRREYPRPGSATATASRATRQGPECPRPHPAHSRRCSASVRETHHRLDNCKCIGAPR